MHTLTTLATATENPLDGLVPDFRIFGAQFTALWQKLMVGLWGVFILVAIGYLMHGILGIAQNRGGHPGQLRESKKEATNSMISLGGLIALGPIVGIAIAVFSP
jgi:hypothetical protein